MGSLCNPKKRKKAPMSCLIGDTCNEMWPEEALEKIINGMRLLFLVK